MPPLTDFLASYIPNLIARGLAADPAPRSEPVAERFPAAVFFADISGFTSLAERLAQQGPAGTEELTRLLNDYFGRLIEIINDHGGDVVKFAGDGLIAVWPTQKDEGKPSTSSFILHNSSLQDVTLRAAQCGLAVQAALHNYLAAEGTRLSLRIGIGAGDILTASVGGLRRRWEHLVAGSPLIQLSRAKSCIHPGQVALSPEAWAYVAGQCVGETLTGGTRLDHVQATLLSQPLTSPVLAAEAEAALRSYIPGAILARLDAGQTDWLAELRRITLLFVQISDLNYEAPDALAQIQAVMYALQNVLYQYEGSVNQFSVDDKGTIMVMAFGLPPLTHEDDPARSLQAALAMQTALKLLGKRSAIGLATGRVFCGVLGSPRRRHYTILGDAVNLAARLMEAAPEAILCDNATYQAAQARFHFESPPPLKLKGKVEPIAVYRPDPLQTKAGVSKSQAHLVGRRAERAMLIERLQALAEQRGGGVVVIEGEAGIGKSRLVDEIRREAEALQLKVYSGAGDAIEKSTSYYAWRAVFSELFEVDLLNDVAARRQHILDLLELEPERRQLAPLLNSVLPLYLPDNEITSQMTGEVRADNTHELLLQSLQASVARAPTVLILEDAHWLDSASWTLALRVSQHVQPLLFIIATRPMEQTTLPAEYTPLLATPGLQKLQLDTLSLEDTTALACQRLGVSALPEPVRRLIREKAGGHPFFTEELAYALRDSGLLLIAEGVCRIAPDAGDLRRLNFPDTVQGVIISRIDRLPPAQQLILKVASVIGHVFTFRLLHDVYPIEADRDQLSNHLETLARLDITPLETPEPDLAYGFKHVISQEVAYNLMLFAQRRELHRAVAEWYERTTPDLTQFYPLLAHHWSKAEVTSKAIDYLEKAGELAFRNGAYQEAVGFFREALALEARAAERNDPARRGHWERLLGEAHLGLGQIAESREHLQKAAALFGWPAPKSRVQLVRSLITELIVQVFHRLWPAQFFGRSRHARDHLLETVRAYERLGDIYYYDSDITMTLNSNLRALNLAEAAGPSPELARVYAGMCVAAGMVPWPALAETYSREAREVVERVGDLPSRFWVTLRTCLYMINRGQWEESQRGFKEIVELADRLGDRRGWQMPTSILGGIAYTLGDFGHGLKLWSDVTMSAQGGNDVQFQVRGLNGEAMCLLRLGRADETLAALDKALPFLTASKDRSGEILHYAVRAIGHLHQGELERAGQAAQHSAQLIAQLSAPAGADLLDGYTYVARTCLALWEINPTPPERHGWIKLARQSCRALHKYARTFPIGQPSAWLWQGLCDWLSGHPAQAHRSWQKSLAAAQRLQMPYDEGLVHYEIGRHLETNNPARRVHLERAREIFTQLGAVYDLEKVRQTEGK